MAMVKCNDCGSSFNMDLVSSCMICEARAEEAERARLEAEANRFTEEERQQQREALRQEFISTALDRIELSLQEGRVPALHDVVFMNTEYTLGEESGGVSPEPHQWASMAWDGWEVVATVPHTAGVPLVNRVAGQNVYAGGIGGIVNGVYLLMRFPISQQLLETRRDYLETWLSHHLDRSPTQSSSTPLPSATATFEPESGATQGSHQVGRAASLGVAGVGVAFAARGVGAYLAHEEAENLAADAGSDFDGGDVDNGGGIFDAFEF